MIKGIIMFKRESDYLQTLNGEHYFIEDNHLNKQIRGWFS